MAFPFNVSLGEWENSLAKTLVGLHATYRKSSHSIFDLKVHLVWITKYRKPVLFGNVATRLRDLIREECNNLDVEILKGHVSKDHVHLFVSMPPHLSVSDLVKHVKGKTSRKMLKLNRLLAKQFWGSSFVGACGILQCPRAMLRMM